MVSRYEKKKSSAETAQSGGTEREEVKERENFKHTILDHFKEQNNRQRETEVAGTE